MTYKIVQRTIDKMHTNIYQLNWRESKSEDLIKIV